MRATTPARWSADADLIIVIESDAPWYPRARGLRRAAASCISARTRRSCAADALVPERSCDCVACVDRAGRARRGAGEQETQHRCAPRQAQRASRGAAQEGRAGRSAEALNTATFSRAVGECVGEDAIIFNEYPLSLEYCPREKPSTFYGLSTAGGLGWGLGAALGAKLAAPEKLIVATVGDGAYMFTNPTVAPLGRRQVRAAGAHRRIQQQPLRRGAARDALDVQGRRGGRGRRPVPRRPFAVAAVRGIRARARRPRRARRKIRGVAPALARARDAVRGGKQALVNVLIPD